MFCTIRIVSCLWSFFLCIGLTIDAFSKTKSMVEDLNMFKSFQTWSKDASEIFSQITGENTIVHIDVGNDIFHFKMRRHDLRSSNYRAEVTGADGIRRLVPSSPVETFIGQNIENPSVSGRFTIAPDHFDGVIFTPGDWTFIEPLRNYVSEALSTDFLVYRYSDIKEEQEWRCGASLIFQKANQIEMDVRESTTSSEVTYKIQIATEADSTLSRRSGGPENLKEDPWRANQRIMSILNQVEGIFEQELNLTFEVTYQHFWTDWRTDPYRGISNAYDLLPAFINHWNENFRDAAEYDLAHMWVSHTKSFAGPENPNITGIASVGSLCSNQGYGITQIRHSFFSTLTTAHEIGHNLGATHPNQEDPPVNACLGTVMQSIQNDAASLTFCDFSKNQIRDHISRNTQCLDPTAISATLQPPYDLQAQVLGPNRVRVWWKDHNGNRATGFRVERSPDGAVPPEAVGWVPAERWDFIDGDLTPHRKYDYRVRAYNDEEMSEPSNVVYASTPAVPKPQFDTPAISAHWVIPTTVHAGGRYGGTFKTKVGLAASRDEVRITARLYGPKGFQQERPILLSSNTYWTLDDFFLQVFKKKGAGAVELIAPKPFHLVAVEVYIDTANGRNITPVINETSPLVPYQGLAYNYGVTVNDSTRVNLGVFKETLIYSFLS